MVKPLEQQVIDFDRKLKNIAQRTVRQAQSSALNKIAQQSRTRITHGVANAARLPKRLIRRRVVIRRSTVKTQRALIKVYSNDIPVVSTLKTKILLNRRARGTNKRGVRAAGRQFDGAFINLAPSGHFQVFKREGQARTPIKVVKIEISKHVEQAVPVSVERTFRQHYERILQQELKFRLQREFIR